MSRTLDAGIRLRLLGRSLLLQAAFGAERMQGLGLGFALEPWLRRCWSGAGLREARLRHQECFNTQPFMAPLLIGMLCRLEEQLAAAPQRERDARLARLRALKAACASSLAGVGDALFWGALRPFAAAFALFAALLLWGLRPETSVLWLPAFYLLAFNALSLAVRWRGLSLGYEAGDRLAARLQEYGAQAWIKRLRWAAAGLALGAAGLALGSLSERPEARLLGALAAAAYFAAARWLPWPVAPQHAYGAAALAGVAAAAAGVDLVIEKELVVGNRLGMHARPAALFVHEAARFKAQVLVSKDGLEINGKSVMGLMLLAAECGAKIKIKCDGPDEKEAMDALQKLLERKFDEE